MSLSQEIEKDFLAAYKAKEDVRVAVLRMLKTAAKNKQVELGRPLTDDEMREVIVRQVKQRHESIDLFRKGGRADLAAREESEMAVLKGYLPAPLTPEETAQAVDQAIAELNACAMKDMGRVVQAVLARHKGRVDGKSVSDLVRARLSA